MNPSEETRVSYPKNGALPFAHYDPANITYQQECAQKIHARFGCLQDNIGEVMFIEHATPIINEYFARMEAELSNRCQCAIDSWEEERQRALREAGRVLSANELLREAFSHVRNIPLADDISAYLSQF